ncbi:MAG: hypothetical protein ACE362_00370 [Phaeodactylibacter xiamenensis]|uniref:DUF3828 domain-containing protein n=1 Tax=Phaeodactylibacter xiamenensis TaxID=1524460 RepID=A0A098SAA7_9BACT|nr:hypothetical protein [Phaeodactylibacter xiamenensis]KGE89066.1 hypothetical protein IX84_04620 [Phaeodactylibacter xiamenensis]MCR9050641.1 hypothetical protein [bacterium]
MKYNNLWPAVIMVVLFGSCGSDAPPPPSEPEAVLKQYQRFVDQNLLEKAKALSTPAGKAWLDELKAIVEEEQPDSTLFHTEFLSVNCEGKKDTLRCQCVLEDQYERYTSDYHLVKLNGQWLVDAPQEEIQIDNDILEQLPDSLVREMMQE